MTAPPLSPGDRLRYGLSVGFDDVWVKLDADIQVQADESAGEAWERVTKLVERLLMKRVEALKSELVK